jgi:hypothetical protein
MVKKAFRASYYASIEFAIHQWGTPKNITKPILNNKQKKEADFFFQFFTPIESEI